MYRFIPSASAVCLLLMTTLLSAAPTTEQLENIWSPDKLVTSDQSAAVKLQRVPIEVRLDGVSQGFPVTFGVPIPKDEIFRTNQMRLLDANGKPIDCSIIPTATWTQAGSLKWVLIDAVSPAGDPAALSAARSADGSPVAPWTLEYGQAVTAAPVENPIKITQNDQSLTVDTGRLVATFSKTRGSVFEKITLDDAVMLDASKATAQKPAGLYFIDQAGKEYRSATSDADYELHVEFASPMRTVIKATGWYVNDQGERACRFITRVYLYRNQPTVRVFSTWVVTVDTDTMQWRDLGMRLPWAMNHTTASTGNDPADISSHIETLLDSHGLEIAQTTAEQGSVTGNGKTLWQGAAVGGWVNVSAADRRGVTLAVPAMSQQFPISLSVKPQEVIFHGFSPAAGHPLGFRLDDLKARYGEKAWEHFKENLYKDPPYEERPSNGIGLARTHELILTFHSPAKSDSKPDAAAQAMLQPPLASASPKWNCDSGAFGPYAAYDAQNFGESEKQISDMLDEWIYATTHMKPHYGYYDYGRGVPYHLAKSTDEQGNLQYIYSGYRRNYDLGYGNTIVPWLMYLRSGDRRWLNVGNKNTRYEMDVRHIHPIYGGGAPRIGFKYWHYGSWSFDGSCLGFQDQWYKNLALCYYTTGYQRALDVYGEIMESAYDAFMVKQSFPLFVPTDRTGRTSITGSVAVYYKTTWDPRFRALYEGLVPSVIATQRDDGTYPIRMPWMEQFFQESLYDMPNPLPEVVDAFTRASEAFVKTPGRSDQEHFSPFGHWWWYQNHKKPVVAAYARKYLEAYNKDPQNLIGSFGMRKLLYVPMWQKLAQVPGASEAELPQSIQIQLPGSRPMFIQHKQGKDTEVLLSYLGEKMEAFDASGNPVPAAWWSHDTGLLAYNLNVPADAPTQRITIRSVAPERLVQKHNWPRLPWWPERDRTVVTYQGENPLVDTPVLFPFDNWDLPADQNPLLPSGIFGNGVRLSKQQHIVIDLGKATNDGHTRAAFDAREGTVEFFIRFETPTYGGTLLDLPNVKLPAEETTQGKSKKAPAYEKLLWLQLSSRWDARMYNQQNDKVLVVYRQQPQIIPGKWHHVAIVWDWDDRDAESIVGQKDKRGRPRKFKEGERGKIIKRLFLDGAPGPVVSGGADDSRTYWPESVELPLPDQFFQIGDSKPMYSVTIDELRISDVMRYPFGTLNDRSFVPPDAPFELDEHTLLLHHFDKQSDGVGRNNTNVPVKYVQTEEKK